MSVAMNVFLIVKQQLSMEAGATIRRLNKVIAEALASLIGRLELEPRRD